MSWQQPLASLRWRTLSPLERQPVLDGFDTASIEAMRPEHLHQPVADAQPVRVIEPGVRAGLRLGDP